MGCVVEVSASTPITFALTPEVAPVIVVFKYCATTTSSPPNCDASCIEVYALEIDTWPGMITVPSL